MIDSSQSAGYQIYNGVVEIGNDGMLRVLGFCQLGVTDTVAATPVKGT